MGDRVIASDSEVGAIAFLPGGNTLAGVCRDGKLRLWDAGSGVLQRSIPWEGAGKKGDVATLASAAGVLATVGADGSIRTWDLRSGEAARSIAGPSQKVRRLT